MQTLEMKTDEELMILYQEGNSEAFQVLYARHAGKIFGFLKSKTQKEEFARDLFQEVFVKIHKSKHLYNKSLPALPWIFTITKNVLIDGLRREKTNNLRSETDLDQIEAPEKSVDSEIGNLVVQIEQLPSTQVTAIKMRYLEEKTFEEIAETLSTSAVNVRQIISRGIKRLKEIIGDGHEDK
jgi:RNA polymerase sigma-70 factor (ECF subfamily)